MASFSSVWILKLIKTTLRVFLEVLLEVLEVALEVLSAWFLSNFQKTLKWLVLALPKSYSIFNKTVWCTEEFRIRNLGQSCL